MAGSLSGNSGKLHSEERDAPRASDRPLPIVGLYNYGGLIDPTFRGAGGVD